MNKIIIFISLIVYVSGCSFNKNSKFWTTSEKIAQEESNSFKEIFIEEATLGQEFNQDKLLNLGTFQNNDSI